MNTFELVLYGALIVSSPRCNDSAASKIRNGISRVIPNTPCLFRTND